MSDILYFTPYASIALDIGKRTYKNEEHLDYSTEREAEAIEKSKWLNIIRIAS